MSVRRSFGSVLIAAGLMLGIALVSGASASAGEHSKVKVVQTTANLWQHLTRVGDLRFGTSLPAGVRVIHVDDRVRYQRIIGFGAALTDSSAWLMYDELSPRARRALLDRLFSPRGINLNLVRVPMGASDFTVGGQPYSYDDLPAGQSDPQLLHFSTAHDDAYIIPTLRQTLHTSPRVQFLATPWSPPPWMKANQAFDNLGNRGRLLPSAFQPLANYFVKFIQAYAARGVPVEAVTPQNEPHSASSWPGMEFPAADESDWIVHDLQPALRVAGLRPRIYGYDDRSYNRITYPQALLSSPARAALAGIAWHCYDGMDAMSALHRADPGVAEILSECSPGIIPYSVAEVTISGTRHWASAVALWNLALDPSGGPVQPPNRGCPHCTGLVTIGERTLVTIGERTHAATVGRGYYQLGQVSKFVKPGAFRISSDRFVTDYHLISGAHGVTAGLDNVAFLNPDGERVLIAYDNSSAPIRFAVQWHHRFLTYKLQPGATVTFTWRGTA